MTMKKFSAIPPHSLPIGTVFHILRPDHIGRFECEIIGWDDGQIVFKCPNWPDGYYDSLRDVSCMLFPENVELKPTGYYAPGGSAENSAEDLAGRAYLLREDIESIISAYLRTGSRNGELRANLLSHLRNLMLRQQVIHQTSVFIPAQPADEVQ